MSSTEMQELFCLAQHGKAKHKKYINMLHDIFRKLHLEEFVKEFMRLLLHAFNADISHVPAKSILEFASSFCVEIVSEHDKRIRETDEDSDSEHPFFVCLVETVLKYVPLSNFNVRYHACQFLALLFGKFDTDIGISDGVCDSIQKALLERIVDIKPQIRCQAIRVLLRLQNTQDVNCPVIECFTDSIIDPVPSVRKLIIESIAPCPSTLGHIIGRLQDVDAGVRAAAFIKLSKITPKVLTIVYRQSIVLSGLGETNTMARQRFENDLLPKWLKGYDSNVIKLMDALKLDAHQEDITLTEQIYKNTLPIIFKMLSLQELLEILNLDDSKLVPIKDLSIEKVNYWSYFLGYLKEVEDVEFDVIAPVLTNFATYIDSFIKFKSEKSLEYWEQLEYQQILRKLFEMLSEMDVSDEFGRQEVQKLIVSVLKNIKLNSDVIGSIIKAFNGIITDVEQLTFELCLIIGDIKNPEEEVVLPIEVRRDQEIQIAQLKVKLHIINDEISTAVQNREYHVIDKLTKEAEKYEQEVKNLEEKFKERPTCVVRKPHNDMETLCRCMDIVLALMENIRIEKMPLALITFRQQFLATENIDARYPGIYHKIFRMTCLFAILDKNLALESIEIICSPVISYKVSTNYDKNVLKTAVGTISDIIRIHGPDIFKNSEDEALPKSCGKKKRTNDRTLYSGTDAEVEVSSVVNIENITLGVLMDIMLDMLDDTTPDIREYAAVSLTKLVVRGLCVNSSLLTRLLLKWFNPILNTDDKHDQKIQRYIGTAIGKYINNVETAPSVFEKAILPTLSSLGNAPKTSPLSEVDYDDVLQCLIKFTNIRENMAMSMHKQIAYSILDKLNNTNEQCVRILSKMLLYLNIPGDEPNVVKELSQEVNIAIDNVSDKLSIKYLKKYFGKLNGIANEVDEGASNLDGTDATKRSSITATINQKTMESVNTSDTENIDPSTTRSEIVEQTPAKRGNRSGAAKAPTTPGNMRSRKKSGQLGSVSTPGILNRKKNGETLLATPARESNRKTRNTNLDTIKEKNKKTATNNVSSKSQASNESDSDSVHSDDSDFVKEGEINKQTPAKQRIRCGSAKALTTPDKMRTRKQTGRLGSVSVPGTRNRKENDETLFATPARESNRKTRSTNIDTIKEKNEETAINDASSKSQTSNESNSASFHSDDSDFVKEGQVQTYGKNLTTSMKRRKIRGRNSSQTDKDNINTSLTGKGSENESGTKKTSTGKKKSLSRDTTAKYTQSSSESENIPEAPPRRKSQRKL